MSSYRHHSYCRPARNRNEYFENAELMGEVDSVCPRGQFSKALMAYASATDPNKRIRMIEAVIRTSRGVAKDATRLTRVDREIIQLIRSHYAAFASRATQSDPETYAEAGDLLRAYFF